jgi:integrase
MPARTSKDLSLKRVVDAIRPGAVRYMVWDTQLAGFGLDVWPSGRKSWILFYRVQGQARRMTIGTTDRMPPAQARTAVLAALSQVGQGIDPLAIRRATVERVEAARRGAATVAAVADRYLATLKSRRSSTWAGEAERLYTTHIRPTLGRMAVRDVAVKDARALHESMAATPVSANRTKAVLSAIITRAIDDGERPRELLNPAGGVRDYPEVERDRYLTEDEWPRVAKAIAALRTELAAAPAWDTRAHQLDALITLALTGARLRAVLPRVWSDVDWTEHAIEVTPAHKGVSRILLGTAAESHLRACFEVRGAAAGYLFPGQTRRVGTRTARYERDARPKRAPSPVGSLASMWARLTELAALEDFTLHDWRRTFATVAGDVGVSDHMIGGLLGHRVPGIRRRYARRTDQALLDAASKVASEVAARLNLKLAGSQKTLPFPARRRVTRERS